MTNEVAVLDQGVVALTVEQVTAQVAHIQRLMGALMREGEHFGTIPGTQKPSLLKAGAEKLGFTFRLIPEFEVKQTDFPGGHREYAVTCTLRHGPTGSAAGQGVGVASSLEAKYRWRKQAVESEVGPVPAAYWDLAKDDYRARQELLAKTYGPGKYRPKKLDGAWIVLRVEGDGDRVENSDLADCYNTILKMAKKRAHVDAIITATAASDLFTQDVEDVLPERVAKPTDAPKADPAGDEKRHAADTPAKRLYMAILADVERIGERGLLSRDACKGFQREMNAALALGEEKGLTAIEGIQKRVKGVLDRAGESAREGSDRFDDDIPWGDPLAKERVVI